jgi:hypothetical protein
MILLDPGSEEFVSPPFDCTGSQLLHHNVLDHLDRLQIISLTESPGDQIRPLPRTALQLAMACRPTGGFFMGCESFTWVTLRDGTVRLAPEAIPQIASTDVQGA